MKKLLLASSMTLMCCSVFAHDIWIKADRHEIHADEQKIFSLDVSRSGNTYVAEANHGVKELMMTGPSGEKSVFKSRYNGETKEVFEVAFDDRGTYYLESPMTQVFLSFYLDEAGKKHKIRLPKSQWHTLPKGSKPLKTVEKQITTETYISYNGFSAVDVKKQTGLVITPLQHPNQIRPNKKFSFELTLDGQPIEHGEVSLTSTNQYYYMDSEKTEIDLSKKQKGLVNFTVDKPGRYLLAVEYQVALKNDKNATERSIERFLSFEITE